jgi:vancomycin resistance protein YoaR
MGVAALGMMAILGLALVGRLAAAPAPRVVLASFATSLKGRTPGQRHNARRSANELNNRVIAPGGVFSFNKAVRTWTSDEGYVKAPVSYDGELIPAYGGGVCQTSTTLYNAALLAGMEIVERHKHVFAAHYAQPGRDAAVAQENIDLRFRNPYSWPVRIEASGRNERLLVKLIGEERPRQSIIIVTEVLNQTTPGRLTRLVNRPNGSGRAFVRNPGARGFRVVTYRVFREGGKETRRERLSDDTYQAMDRIIQASGSSRTVQASGYRERVSAAPE